MDDLAQSIGDQGDAAIPATSAGIGARGRADREPNPGTVRPSGAAGRRRRIALETAIETLVDLGAIAPAIGDELTSVSPREWVDAIVRTAARLRRGYARRAGVNRFASSLETDPVPALVLRPKGPSK